MKLLVSACLLGENCKYNGSNNYNEKVAAFVKGHEVVCVCPEVMGNLPVPRIPCEICNGRVLNKNGEDVTYQFETGAELALKEALKNNVDAAILKANSPSCGYGSIYEGSFSGILISGNGKFAQLLKNKGIPVYTENNLPE